MGRPPIYIFKHGLHLAIILLIIPNFFIFPGGKKDGYRQVYDILRLITSGVQIVLWLMSSIILRFEYRRALGHIWYMHPVFLWVSALVYGIDVAYCQIYKDGTNESLNRWELHLMTACTFLILACTITLAILVLVYP